MIYYINIIFSINYYFFVYTIFLNTQIRDKSLTYSLHLIVILITLIVLLIDQLNYCNFLCIFLNLLILF